MAVRETVEMIKNRREQRDIKGGKVLLHFTWTSKMMTPVQCDKLYVYNVTPKTTTNMLCKEIQKDTLKTIKINQNGILKIVEVTHRKVRKKNKETKKERRNIKQTKN